MSRDQSSGERAPLCPICQHRHWGREPHVWNKATAAAPAAKKAKFKGKKRG